MEKKKILEEIARFRKLSNIDNQEQINEGILGDILKNILFGDKDLTWDEILDLFFGKLKNKVEQKKEDSDTSSDVTKPEVTDDDEYVIIKSDSYKGNQVHVLFGGSHTSGYSKGSANPSAMKKYVPYLKPYSDNKIIVITHHYNSLSNVKEYIKEKFNGEVTSIAGFSQGGKETWKHADDSSLSLVGLIDPSTYNTDVTFGPNTYLVCDPNNWGDNDFYGQVKNRLKWYCSHKDDAKYSGHVECTTGKKHMDFGILEYFYQKYGSKI